MRTYPFLKIPASAGAPAIENEPPIPPAIAAPQPGSPLENGPLWPLLVGALLLLQAVLVLGHQPWLDEYQALQIALQSPDLPALFENLRYEGHPPLWYLILRAAASVLPPAAVLPAVQLPIALGIQSIILIRSPFSRLEKLLIAASFFVLFDFATLSRSLALGVLLLVGAFAWRDRRAAWLAIGLLPMVDFLFGVLGGVLIVILWREKRLWAPGIALYLIAGLASALTVRPAPDMIPAFWLNGIAQDGAMTVMRFGSLFLPLHMLDSVPTWNESMHPLFTLPAGAAFIGLGYLWLRADKFSATIFLGFVALCLGFSVTVYPLAIRHLSLSALLLILLVWRLRERNLPVEPAPLFRLWLGCATACGLLVAGINLFVQPFDTARAAARYIEDHHLEQRHWVVYPDSRAQGVSALLGIEFERLERDCAQSFIRWNYRSKVKKARHLKDELARIAARDGGFHLLTDFELPLRKLGARDYRLLTAIPAGYDGQKFFLYAVRPDLPESGRPLPQCAPRRLPLRLLPSQAAL